MRSHVLTVGDLTLHVVEYGGAGPPLLAVHGTGMVAQVWGVLAPYLTPHFRVFALDRRGHGDSAQPATGYEIEHNAADYLGVVQQLSDKDWVGLGHSSGGTSLAVAAARQPGIFHRLALVDPIIFPPRPPGQPATAGAAEMAERTRRRRATWPSLAEMIASLGSRPPFDTWQPAALADYCRFGTVAAPDGSVTLKCPPDLEAEMYRHASAIDLFAEFDRITAPTLILRGARTDRFPSASATRAIARMPFGHLRELPGLGHFAPMEDPERVGRLCSTFLQTGRVV